MRLKLASQKGGPLIRKDRCPYRKRDTKTPPFCPRSSPTRRHHLQATERGLIMNWLCQQPDCTLPGSRIARWHLCYWGQTIFNVIIQKQRRTSTEKVQLKINLTVRSRKTFQCRRHKASHLSDDQNRPMHLQVHNAEATETTPSYTTQRPPRPSPGTQCRGHWVTWRMQSKGLER